MKRIFTLLFAVTTLLGCNSNYDDSALTGRMDDLENRVAKLEELCKQMNTNISSLQTLVNTQENKDYITSIVPITKDGETIGYTISFSKSAPITIYNGQDGKPGENGTTPVIGVKQDTDGIYYWTLNGSWLTNDSGNKIKAEGQDGNTPKLKIEAGSWYLSYDNGNSWTKVGNAQGDSMFSNVTVNDDNVVFELSSGTTITVPKKIELNIIFDETEPISALPDHTYEIKYTIVGATANTAIEAISKNGYSADVVKADNLSGTIKITTPNPIRNSSVMVFVNNDTEHTIVRFINFAERVINITTDSYTATADGGNVPVTITTNVDFTVLIKDEDRGWLNLIPETRAATKEETLMFKVEANPNMAFRQTTVKLHDEQGNTTQSIFFTQAPLGYKAIHLQSNEYLFQKITDDEKNKLVWLEISGQLKRSDCDFINTLPSLRKLDISQLSDTTLPYSGCFQDNTSLETIVLPKNLTEIPPYAFYRSHIASINIPETVRIIQSGAFADCTNLSGTITLPTTITEIASKTFQNCNNLSGIVLPDNLSIIDDSAFENTGLISISFPASLKSIGNRAFYGCQRLSGSLILPDGLQSIGSNAFAGGEVEYLNVFTPSNQLSGDLIIPNSVESIGVMAFEGCGFDGKLTLGEGITIIGDRAFAGCQFCGDLLIPSNITAIGARAFRNCNKLNSNLVIEKNVEEIYQDAFALWTLNSPSPLVIGIRSIPFSNVYSKAMTPPSIPEAGSSHPFAYGIKHLFVPIGTKAAYKTAWYLSLATSDIQEFKY